MTPPVLKVLDQCRYSGQRAVWSIALVDQRRRCECLVKGLVSQDIQYWIGCFQSFD
jgi:hypothetical protein